MLRLSGARDAGSFFTTTRVCLASVPSSRVRRLQVPSSSSETSLDASATFCHGK